MNRWKRFALRVGLGLLLTFVPALAWTQPEVCRWVEITNASKKSTGNDLDLRFTADLTSITYEKADKDKTRRGGTLGSPPNTATWSKSDLDDSVPPGETRRIRYCSKAGASLDTKSTDTHFTEDGDPIDNSIVSLGLPPRIFVDTTGTGFAEFTNPDAFEVVYSNIQLFANNDPLNLTIDKFDVPTGTLVTGLPTSITLAAHASQTLSFGMVSASSYQLASADAASSAEPNSKFSVGTAAVPEPGALITASLAFACAALARRRDRIRAGPPHGQS